MNLKFKGQIWKAGNSYVVTIPIALMETGKLPNGKEMEFSVEVSK